MLELSDVFFDFSMKLWDTPNIVIICLSFGSLVDHPSDLRRLLYLFRATAVTYYLVDYLSYSLFILLLYMQSLKSDHEYEKNMFNFRLICI